MIWLVCGAVWVAAAVLFTVVVCAARRDPWTVGQPEESTGDDDD